MKKYFTLIEIAHDLGMPIDELIQYAAHDELTISVIAQGWSGSSTNGLADTILEGLVDLDSSDLLQSLGADHTTVRKVKEHNLDGFVTLDAPVIVQRGLHLVTAGELKRFRAEHCNIEPKQEWVIPPPPDFFRCEVVECYDGGASTRKRRKLVKEFSEANYATRSRPTTPT